MRKLLAAFLLCAVIIVPADAANRKPQNSNDGWVRCALARFGPGHVLKRYNKKMGWMECRLAPQAPKKK